MPYYYPHGSLLLASDLTDVHRLRPVIVTSDVDRPYVEQGVYGRLSEYAERSSAGSNPLPEEIRL